MENEVFFRQLQGHLKGLTEEEQTDVVEFYREYASDAGLTGEKLIREFGTPKQLARRVLVDYSIRYDDIIDNDAPDENESTRVQQTKRVRRQMNLLWVVLLALLTSWAWIPAVLMILAGLFVLVVMVVLTIFLLALSAVVGVIMLVGGVGVLSQSLAVGFFWIGIGLILTGIQFIAWPIGLLILKVALDGLINFVKFLGRRFSKQKGEQIHA